jgi:hypothetical protein
MLGVPDAINNVEPRPCVGGVCYLMPERSEVMARAMWLRLRAIDHKTEADWDALPENEKFFTRMLAEAAAEALDTFQAKKGL